LTASAPVSFTAAARYIKKWTKSYHAARTQVEVLNSLSNVVTPKDFVLAEYVNACGALIREK
jgi:hypothetical protein